MNRAHFNVSQSQTLLMDPCPFVRILVSNLALKIPLASKLTSSSPCFVEIKLKTFPSQTAELPFILPDHHFPDSQSQSLAAAFSLSKSDLDKLAAKFLLAEKKLRLKIAIYTGRRGMSCGVNSGKLLGKVKVPLNLSGSEIKACVFHNGWVSVGEDKAAASFHVNVKAEPDPRFVFQFDGEPECSPQVFQIQGNLRQPVFTCKFSFRTSLDQRAHGSSSRKWLSSFGTERPGEERKGWSITVHDLSGSPVATASMVTPFVASPAGSDRVSRSNPGSWLILRPGEGTWKPWGRLEAWRERGSSDALGYRFELIPDTNGSMMAATIVLAESTLSSSKGGKFVIDLISTTKASGNTPVGSPETGGEHGYGLWPYCMYRGFVMSASVEGEGKCSKPSMEVSVQHVTCAEDAAAFVALAAAIDLSMDACMVFTQKLRKELRQHQDLLE